MNAPIRPAEIDIDNGTPSSRVFGDVYFSRHGGVEETRYVFIEGNHLVERFEQCGDHFYIAEMGFGTGLNFLLTAKLWCETAPDDATLHFVSIEKYPLTLVQLRQIYQQHPLREYAEQLYTHYPLLVPGVHRILLYEGRVELTLLFADIVQALKHFTYSSIDAWFLDGFAPAKNESMWHDEQLQLIAQTTKPQGTFATFTAVGRIRRALEQSGFQVKKRSGFGYKRDMLVGEKNGIAPACHQTSATPHVLVIGAGIAGTSVAYACAEAGADVTILERETDIAQGASGNPAGILYPYMSKQWDAATQYYLQGFAYTVSLLQRLPEIRYALCGMSHYTKIAGDDAASLRLRSLADMLELDSSVLHATDRGFHMPQSGWVDVPSFCRALSMHERIMLRMGCDVLSVEEKDEQWLVRTTTGDYNATHIVFANAYHTNQLLDESPLPLKKIRGQITYMPETAVKQSLNHVICYGGYMTPAIEGVHYLGATFEKEREDLVVDTQGHQNNIEQLAKHFPDMISTSIQYHDLKGRASFRTVSADRMPIVGAMHDATLLEEMLRIIPYSKRSLEQLTIPTRPRCHITTAHGARGLVSAPLAGQMIAACIMKSHIAPISKAINDLLAPERFMLRHWRRTPR